MADVKEPIKLTISQLQADLKAGLNRKEQAKKYGIPLAALNREYKKSDKLKGKRVFTPRGSKLTQIELIDDVETEVKPEVGTGSDTANQETTQAGTPDAQTSEAPQAQTEVAAQVGEAEGNKVSW